MKKSAILLLVLIIPATINSYAQPVGYTLTDQSALTIRGTSTLHDWECTVDDFTAQAQIRGDATSGETLVEQFSLVARVISIECGKGAMNKKTYEALKEKTHPAISFTVTNASLASGINKGEPFDLDVEGDLIIAGITRAVSFPVKGQLLDSKQYQFDGSYKLNMKDYEVDPPSAMFGTVRAGEEVEIIFSVTLAP